MSSPIRTEYIISLLVNTMQILKDEPDNFTTLQHQNNQFMHECNYYSSNVGINMKIQIFPTEPQH